MLRTFGAALLLAAIALGQAEKSPLRFEVCDIQVSKITDPRQMKADFLPGGRVDVRGMPLKIIIAAVNKVGEDMVAGPAWMASERYDIVAKAVQTSTEDQLLEMARNMLLDRFKMVAHTEKKVMPVYALVAGKKGVAMTEAKVSGTDEGCQVVPSAPGQNDPPGVFHRACHAIAMADLAGMLPRIAPAYFQGQPVVDLTELKGVFDFKLDWMGRGIYESAMANAGSGAPSDERAISIFDAVERLGLKLESRKYPMDMIVVDSILRTPTEN